MSVLMTEIRTIESHLGLFVRRPTFCTLLKHAIFWKKKIDIFFLFLPKTYIVGTC